MPDERSLAALQTSHLKDDAYEAIRAALTDLTLPPGASISENWLVSQLGISKTPIRHALTRLEQEGLVHTIPFKGTFASGTRDDDAKDLLEVRTVLEQAAARRVASQASAADLAHLRELANEGATAEAAGEHRAALVRIGDFHVELVRLAGNPWLVRNYDALGGPLDRLRSISGSSEDSIVDSTAEHFEIVDALADGDGERAAALLGVHIDRVLTLYVAGARSVLSGRP
jgi:DNA-binding GntR family transcriptional regulator